MKKITGLKYLEVNKKYVFDYKTFYLESFTDFDIENGVGEDIFYLTLVNTKKELFLIDGEFYCKENDYQAITQSMYYPLLQEIIAKEKAYTYIDSKDKMLEFCNEHGKYIDSKYYDLKDMNDCINYMIDCHNNYCDEFMYRNSNLDYYDEDYYINYHYYKIGREMFLKEEFWELIKNSSLSTEDIGDILETSFLSFDDFKDIIYSFSNIDNMKFLFNIIEQEDYHYNEIELIEEVDNFIKDYHNRIILKNDIEQELNKIEIQEIKTKKKSKI